MSGSIPSDTLQDRDHPVCEDLLLAILEQMSSKSLIPLRRVSRLFVALIEEVLRARFLTIATSARTEIILESCTPYNSREPSRQVLTFSRFEHSGFPVEPLSAHFDIATREPHYLPLEETEVFGNNLLGVTLESISIPAAEVSASEETRTVNMPYTRIDGNARTPPRHFSDFSWQLSLASSLDRLFREWFLLPAPKSSRLLDEDDYPSSPTSEGNDSDDVLSVSPPSSHETTPPTHSVVAPSRIQLFHPSNQWPTSTRIPSAFKSASLECLSHAGAAPPRPWPFASPSVGFLEFEYYFDSICLDVAKVVIRAEEGLKGKTYSPFTLFA